MIHSARTLALLVITTAALVTLSACGKSVPPSSSPNATPSASSTPATKSNQTPSESGGEEEDTSLGYSRGNGKAWGYINVLDSSGGFAGLSDGVTVDDVLNPLFSSLLYAPGGYHRAPSLGKGAWVDTDITGGGSVGCEIAVPMVIGPNNDVVIVRATTPAVSTTTAACALAYQTLTKYFVQDQENFAGDDAWEQERPAHAPAVAQELQKNCPDLYSDFAAQPTNLLNNLDKIDENAAVAAKAWPNLEHDLDSGNCEAFREDYPGWLAAVNVG